ncbi:hypothetical protein MMC30_002758 [Trapelia coarctata]|nr:hypothetical protein [Trapelia coarctata]
MPSPSEVSNICIITPKHHIHIIKLALEHHGSIKKKGKIQAIHSEADLSEYIIQNDFQFIQNLVAVPTTLTANGTTTPEIQASLSPVANVLYTTDGLESLIQDITLAVHRSPASSADAQRLEDQPKGLLARTILEWLAQLPPSILKTLPSSIHNTLTRNSGTYTIYAPLLLLPAPNSKTDPWPWLLSEPLVEHVPDLYDLICKNLHVTHIALNAPIPLLSPSSSSSSSENILRAPISFTPLHGYFGALKPPSPAAFETAFWVSTRQHGVYQTWAPLYTMFSRGNISEKARILQLPTLMPEILGYAPAECSAVDLYAGIGYFAFCYARAGVGRVLCWEVSPWSVEGLRRGGRGNGWGVRFEDGGEMGEEEGVGDEKLIVFQEDNQRASARIEKLRSQIPPIRHVNCGFLPSSSTSWPVAVAVLDPVQGGWIHVHENIAVTDIEGRRAQIIQEFDALANPDANSPHWNIQCQHLQRVKSYAPGVMHCVLDISISHAPANAKATPTPPMPEAPS